LDVVQAQFEEQKHQVTTVDVENLQLIDRLHTMSSEVAYLKTTISEKEKQKEGLHRALEDGAMLESSMRGEIEQQHCRCEELECEIQGLQVVHTHSVKNRVLRFM
jgi:chromosome segregation ATPase